MGFFFFGFRFGSEGFPIAGKTIEKFLSRAVRLYEQGQGEPLGSPQLGFYVLRVVREVRGITSENTPEKRE
jgi:hypothetical protein